MPERLAGQGGAAGIAAAAGVVEITSTMRQEKPGEQGDVHGVGGQWVANQRGQVRRQSAPGSLHFIPLAESISVSLTPTPARRFACEPADRHQQQGKQTRVGNEGGSAVDRNQYCRLSACMEPPQFFTSIGYGIALGKR